MVQIIHNLTFHACRTRVNTRVQMQKTCVVLDHVYTRVKFNARM